MASSLQFIKKVIGTNVSNFELTNIFSDKYDIYQIQITQAEISNDDYNYFRVINASGTDSGSNYDYANFFMYGHTTFADIKAEGSTTANYLGYLYPANYDDGIGVTMSVFNPYDSSSYTSFSAKVSGHADGVGLYGSTSSMIHKVTQQITGLSIQRTGTFKHIKANIYGVKRWVVVLLS